MPEESILSLLKKEGVKITNTRKLLLEFLTSVSSPVSVFDILEFFSKKKNPVNKTTIYRELEFLLGKEIVRSVYIDEKQMKYELASDHHHHLVCQKCEKVEEISLEEMEKVFTSFEKKLLKKHSFKNIIHSLEFFGVCKNCAL